MDIERLIAFYHDLAPESVVRLPEFYGAHAYFKDPFNEVRGVAAIQNIFMHMFRQLEHPRFVVTGHVADANGAALLWEFSYCVRQWGRSKTQTIRGITHLRFDADGKVDYHRDYWDAAEELYMKLPIIGCLMRCLQRMLSAPHRD